MFAKSSEQLSQKLLQSNIITKEQYEICKFGFQQGFTVLLNFCTVAAVGLALHAFSSAMLFLAGFIPLRRFAGGYHAKTPLRCYLYSVGVMIAMLFGMKTALPAAVCFITFGIASAAIFAFAPVEDQHKPLDKIEHAVYQKRTRIVLIIEFVLFAASFFLHVQRLFICLTWAVASAAILLILGKCKNAIRTEA